LTQWRTRISKALPEACLLVLHKLPVLWTDGLSRSGVVNFESVVVFVVVNAAADVLCLRASLVV
jgi:hypothetical protein